MSSLHFARFSHIIVISLLSNSIGLYWKYFPFRKDIKKIQDICFSCLERQGVFSSHPDIKNPQFKHTVTSRIFIFLTNTNLYTMLLTMEVISPSVGENVFFGE